MFYYLNQNVKYLRKSRKMTQPELAEMLNISTSSLNNFEGGQKNTSLEVLDKLRNIFNISLKGLMNDFNKIYEFEDFLTHSDYQKYLNLMYEYCELIINTVEDVNNILKLKVEYFDNVINSIYLNKEDYYFYYLDGNNEEIIIEDVNGSVFLENNLHIKYRENIEDDEEIDDELIENKDEIK